jgi:general secretion pathway protein G
MSERSREPRHERSRGFSLVELMVVVTILAILAATIIPQFTTASQDAKVSRAQADIAKLESALERFFIHMDRYPTNEEGLRALTSAPSESARHWRGPYIRELLADPWGNAYLYRQPGSQGLPYELWSRGADGADGGDGYNADITNARGEEAR